MHRFVFWIRCLFAHWTARNDVVSPLLSIVERYPEDIDDCADW
jgi:hypothetical protein